MRSALERRTTEIIGWHLEGRTDKEIAAQVSSKRRSYTPQAVSAFRKRHRAEIDELRGKVAAAVEDVTIRDKSERIRRHAALVDGMQAIIETRGLMATDLKFVGGSEHGREVEVVRFDAALVREYRAELAAVAEELGELPKTPLIDARTQQLILSLDVLKEIKQRAGD